MGNQGKDIKVEKNDTSLIITIPWFRGIEAIVGIVLMIASFYFISQGGVSWVFAILLGYIALGLIINKTEIIVNHQKIVIQHGPFPSPASKRSILISNVGEWKIDDKKSFDDYGNVVATSYHLQVQNLSSGKYITLIKGGKNRPEIMLIQKEIKSYIRSIKELHLTVSNLDDEVC